MTTRILPKYATGIRYNGYALPRAWVRPFIAWGAPYGAMAITGSKSSDEPRWLQRCGQRCRWYDGDGNQVGPEQRNVAPAVAWAGEQG